MDEAYTVRVSQELVEHLFDDGKKVEKKTRKPKLKTNRLDTSKTIPPATPDHNKDSETLHPLKQLSDDQKPANAEPLDAILPVLDRNEKVVESLQKQNEDMSKENDLDGKEVVKNPDPAVIPSLDEKEACSKCNNEDGWKGPLKNSGLVEGFAECRRVFREQVGILKDFLDEFRGK